MILVDGTESGRVDAADRGLAYGDGVFRTVRVKNGIAQHWGRQRAKLAADCRALGIEFPSQILEPELERMCAAEPDCALKIVITRGSGERGYRYVSGAPVTRILLSAPLPDHSQHGDNGVSVRLCRLKLAHQPALAGVKHLNRLENVLARAEWTDPGVAEGILCDLQGCVIGGTMTNLFIVKHGRLETPSVQCCGVAGVTRDRVIEAAGRHDVVCKVTMLMMRDVLDADEVFLVNSLAGAWPVSDIEGAPRTVGPLTRQVQNWLQQEDNAQMA